MPWRYEIARIYASLAALQGQIVALSIAQPPAGASIAGLFACTPGTVAVGDCVRETIAGTFCDRAIAASAVGAAIGVCLQLVNPALALIVFNGEVTSFVGLTPDAIYYLDNATPGGIVTVAPSSIGQIVQKIGRSKNSTTLVVEVTPQFIQL